MSKIFEQIPDKKKHDYPIALKIFDVNFHQRNTIENHNKMGSLKRVTILNVGKDGEQRKSLKKKKRVYTVWFYLNEVLEQAKDWKTIRKVVVSGVGELDRKGHEETCLGDVYVVLMEFSVTRLQFVKTP